MTKEQYVDKKIRPKSKPRRPKTGHIMTDKAVDALRVVVNILGGQASAAKILNTSQTNLSLLLKKKRTLAPDLVERVVEQSNGLFTTETFTKDLDSYFTFDDIFFAISKQAREKTQDEDYRDFMYNMTLAILHYLQYNEIKNEKDALYLSYLFAVEPQVFNAVGKRK